MASDKLIKFFRGASAPTNAQIGAIFFDTDTREIKVKTGTANDAWEAYAGKIKDVVWDSAAQTLTITRNDGTNKTVNFSDVASASALTTLEGKFNTLKSSFETEQGYIDALQTTVGDSKSGLVKASADHTAALAKLHGAATEEGSIAYQIKAAVDAEALIRETADNGLTTRLNGVDTTLNGHDTRITELETFKNGQTTAVNNAIDAKINALGGEATGDGSLIDVTVKTEKGQVKTVSVDETALTTRLSGLDTAIDNAVAGIDEKLGATYTKDNSVAKAIQAAADAAAAAQRDIDSFLKAEEVADAAIDTLKEIQDWIANDETGTEALIGRVSANESAISTLNSKVDVTKVSSAIATAKQEAIDAAATTAQTKADAAKEAAIAAAATDATTKVNKLGETVSANGTAIAGLTATIEALDVTDTAVDGKYVSAVSQADGKITVSRADLPSATVGSKTVATGKHVAVEVVETAGKLTALTVNESDIASAEALSQLTTKVNGLEADLAAAWLWEEFN